MNGLNKPILVVFVRDVQQGAKRRRMRGTIFTIHAAHVLRSPVVLRTDWEGAQVDECEREKWEVRTTLAKMSEWV